MNYVELDESVINPVYYKVGYTHNYVMVKLWDMDGEEDLTVAEARHLAKAILQAADKAEEMCRTYFNELPS